MRDSECAEERTGKKRMLVLGDSFGWGFGVEQRERFSELLENRHPDWEIINASVSGYGTDQELLFLEEKGIAFKADVVLLLFCDNDFDSNLLADDCWHFKPYFLVEHGRLQLHNVPVPKTTARQQLRRFFIGRTYLGQRLHAAMKDLLKGRRRAQSVQAAGGQSSADDQRMNDVTGALLRRMNEVCKRNDSALLLVSVPMDAGRSARLQKLAEAEKIAYLPLDAQFASAATRTSFLHDTHWNASGHEIAANAIDAFFWKSGLFSE